MNIEVSIEVCSDSVHCFRKFMSSTEEKSINRCFLEQFHGTTFENSSKVYQYEFTRGWYYCNDSGGICQILSWGGWNTFTWWAGNVWTPFSIKVFRWTVGWFINGKLLLRLIRKSPSAIQGITRFWFEHSFYTWFIQRCLRKFMWNSKLWILWRSVDWTERWTWMLVRPYTTFEVSFKNLSFKYWNII